MVRATEGASSSHSPFFNLSYHLSQKKNWGRLVNRRARLESGYQVRRVEDLALVGRLGGNSCKKVRACQAIQVPSLRE